VSDRGREALPASPIALFRYRLVAEVETRVLGGEGTSAAVAAVAACHHLDGRGRRVTVHRRSLYRWLAAYRERGMAGLEPAARGRIQTSRALPPELVEFLRREKTRDPQASVPEVLKRARRLGVVAADQPIDRVTAWRACRRMGLPVARRKKAQDRDLRRYAFPHRMMMTLADGKEFRAGEKRAKRVAFTFLDDATRYGLGVRVGTVESVELFLTELHDVVARYGVPDACFLDRGGGFVAHDTHRVFGQLGVHFIHGTAGHAEGRAKIERYHRTLNGQLLRTFPGNPLIDPDLGALTLRLSHWLEVYNHTPHEGLDGDTPAQRWHAEADARPLDLPDPEWLRAQFLLTVSRRVKLDNTLPFEGRAYEVPRGHATERVTVYRHLLERDDDGHERISILHDGRRVVLHPVDPTRNAYSGRARGRKPPPAPSGPPSKSAAELAFDDDFRPLVDPDGGYPEKENRDDDSDPDLPDDG